MKNSIIDELKKHNREMVRLLSEEVFIENLGAHYQKIHDIIEDMSAASIAAGVKVIHPLHALRKIDRLLADLPHGPELKQDLETLRDLLVKTGVKTANTKQCIRRLREIPGTEELVNLLDHGPEIGALPENVLPRLQELASCIILKEVSSDFESGKGLSPIEDLLYMIETSKEEEKSLPSPPIKELDSAEEIHRVETHVHIHIHR